jgi:uncharacterized protein YcbK (DUF882 family)
MLPVIAQLRTAATLMSLASPMPVPVTGMMEAAYEPVEVPLFDDNARTSASVAIRHDGTLDDASAAQVRHLFRCPQTGNQHAIARRTLAMLADLAEHYPGKPIEFVSGYRDFAGEPMESPHRDGRAIDFRIHDVPLREVRDYLWRKYTEVGIGWYPYERFLHMDSRPGLHDTAWTFAEGDNHYNPYWAELARQPPKPPGPPHKPGV